MFGKRGRQHLGVPLHAEAKAHPWMPQRFDHPVGSGGDYFKPVSRSKHRLMVELVHLDGVAIQNSL